MNAWLKGLLFGIPPEEPKMPEAVAVNIDEHADYLDALGKALPIGTVQEWNKAGILMRRCAQLMRMQQMQIALLRIELERKRGK